MIDEGGAVNIVYMNFNKSFGKPNQGKTCTVVNGECCSAEKPRDAGTYSSSMKVVAQLGRVVKKAFSKFASISQGIEY